MTKESTIIPQEIAKFSEHASQWWDKKGPLKTLHDINLARMDFILKYTDIAHKKILDLGCGGGILSESLARKHAIVTGLDASEDAIHAAKDHAQRTKLSIEYICSPVEDYESPGFDIIVCMEMLEHVESPELVIKHCARLLKPDGYLFLSTINRTLKAYLTAIVGAEYVLALLPRQTHDYEKFIKPSELLALTRKEGLAFEGMMGMTYNPITRKAYLQDSVSVNYLVCCRNAGEDISRTPRDPSLED